MASTNQDVKLSEEDLERKKKKEDKAQKPQTLSHLSASVFFYSADFNLTAPGKNASHFSLSIYSRYNICDFSSHLTGLDIDFASNNVQMHNRCVLSFGLDVLSRIYYLAKKTQIGLSSSRVGEETTVNLAATTMASTNPYVKLSEEDLERKKKKEEKAQKPQTLSHLSASVFFHSADFKNSSHFSLSIYSRYNICDFSSHLTGLDIDFASNNVQMHNRCVPSFGLDVLFRIYYLAKKTQIGLSSYRVREEITVNLAATTMASTNLDVKLSEEDLERKKKKEEKAQQGAASSKTNKKNIVRVDASEENPQDFIDPETPSGDKKKLSQQMTKQFPPPVVVEKSLVFIS
ncbi:hypothetical protein L1887_38747 [Cichorium endivia]|nr:hypothetical protein L1887_38747 [Cichorium endivia]